MPEALGDLLIGAVVLVVLAVCLFCWLAIVWLFTRAWVEFKKLWAPNPGGR